ncbi:histidine--tRNA ligase [Elusimicrobiota bacterium]
MKHVVKSPRGTRDIIGAALAPFLLLEKISREKACLWGFEEIRFPSFEHAQLFEKGTGDTTDIVEKEMYVFEDRGGRKLALRPEGTPSVVRAYIENNLSSIRKKAALFYIGSMFRAERPQAGRYREFEHIGFEYFGDAQAYADFEVMCLANSILVEFGIKPKFWVSSIGCPQCRKPYSVSVRSSLKDIEAQLCQDCKRRIEKNPLRALDCKICSHKTAQLAPPFSKCDACAGHEQNLLDLLKASNVPYELNPKIVRGLDYYTRTVFEITATDDPASIAIGGGGRYDGLVEVFGGPKTPAAGFAFGADRVVEALAGTQQGTANEKEKPVSERIFLTSAADNPEVISHVVGTAQKLRGDGVAAELSILTDSLKSQLRQAGKSGARFCATIGEEEVKSGEFSFKNFVTGESKKLLYEAMVKHVKNA